MDQKKKINPAVATIIIIVLVGIVTAGVVYANLIKDTTTTDVSETEGVEAQTSTPATTNEEAYKDGTYTETGTYISPGGPESIEVTITLASDVITDAKVVANATDPESREHQLDFISGFKKVVIVKDIDTVSLSRVAGSSLTPNGFNKALELIKTDAQA